MIILYDPSSDDFSNNGVCVLQPTMCEVEEEAGGMYELRLTHPITGDQRANAIQHGMLIKAPVPARETPLIQITAEGHEVQAEHEIWKVTETTASLWTQPKSQYPAWASDTVYSAGAKRRYSGKSYQAVVPVINVPPPGGGWKAIPAPSSVIKKLYQNNELLYIAQADSTWSKVTESTGITGYMYTSGIEYLRTEPYIPELPSYQTAVQPRKIKDQLFRIYHIEVDSKSRTLSVEARHVFYDLLGNIIKDYRAVKQNPQDVLNAISADLCNEHDFMFYTNLTGEVSSECALKNGVEALLDTEIGIVPKTGAQLIRDNFDVFVLQNADVDRGVRIEYGKNMLGIKVKENRSVTTRIIPVGKDENGKNLKLPEIFVDSQYIDNYPIPYARVIFYDDVQVKAATEEEEAVTTEDAYGLLREKVAAEYAAKCDIPDIEVEVEYILLGDTVEYAAFKDLQQVFLYDIIVAKYRPMNLAFAMQVTGDVYDAILERFKKTKLSNKLNISDAGTFWSM